MSKNICQHYLYIFLVIEYEDEIQPYLDVTKSVYKEVVSVQKDGESKAIQVVSPVFKVEALVSFLASDKA